MKALSFILLFSLAGCSLTVSPPGESEERARLITEKKPYLQDVSQRQVPDLTQKAPLRDVMLYALQVNGEVEASYFEWASAIEQVVLAGALPDSMLSLQLLSARENFSTLNAFLDSARLMLEQDLPSLGKRTKDSEIALSKARAAGERFRGTRSKLYREVVQAYGELQATQQFRHETETTLGLLQKSQDLSTHRFHSGTTTALIDIRKLQLEIDAQRSELKRLSNEQEKAKASFNRLLNRDPGATLGKLDENTIQLSLPQDEKLRATVLERNPSLREALALRDAGKGELVRAELERLPDYGVSAGIDDMLLPYLGVSVTLPINGARVDAGVRAAEAARAAMIARLRDSESDALMKYSIAMSSVRDAERVISDVSQKFLPETQDLLELQQGAYASGEGEILAILDTERALSALRRLVISAQTQRQGSYGEIAEVAADDLLGLFPENTRSASMMAEEGR